MQTISINNGYSTTSPAFAITIIGWDAIVAAMDDDIREAVHNSGDYTPDEFLVEYLKRAPHPLVLG